MMIKDIIIYTDQLLIKIFIYFLINDDNFFIIKIIIFYLITNKIEI